MRLAEYIQYFYLIDLGYDFLYFIPLINISRFETS